MLSRGWGWHRHTERAVRWLLPGVCGPAGHSGTREGKKPIKSLVQPQDFRGFRAKL